MISIGKKALKKYSTFLGCLYMNRSKYLKNDNILHSPNFHNNLIYSTNRSTSTIAPYYGRKTTICLLFTSVIFLVSIPPNCSFYSSTKPLLFLDSNKHTKREVDTNSTSLFLIIPVINNGKVLNSLFLH